MVIGARGRFRPNPIRSASDTLRRIADAARFAWRTREWWPLAAAAFLLRGGIVAMLLPVVVLPSPVALTAGPGLDAVSIAGRATPWLEQTLVVVIVAVAVWLVLAGLVGVLADWQLIGAANDRDLLPVPPRRIVGGMLAIRAIFFVPTVLVLVWLVIVIGFTVTDEIRLPTDLSHPLYLVIFIRALPAFVVGLICWLVLESLAAVGTRRFVLRGNGIWAAAAGAVVQLITRPISSLVTSVVAFVGSVVAVGVPLAVAFLAFDWCRIAARSDPIALKIDVLMLHTTRDARPLVLVLAATALAASWIAALVIAAAASAWRSGAYTGETLVALAEPSPD